MATGPIPHATIGCQQLLAHTSVSYSGFLRKQLTYRNNNIIGTLVKKLRWDNRYVVLCDGSLYHFQDEQSKSPKGCYSLYLYNQVVRAGDIAQTSYPWAIKIVHTTGDPRKLKYFAAASEVELKKWLIEIRKQLVIANGSLLSKSKISLSAFSFDNDMTDDDVEKPIYNSPDEEYSEDKAVSDDDDYIQIPENELESDPSKVQRSQSLTRPLPALPGEKRKAPKAGFFNDAYSDRDIVLPSTKPNPRLCQPRPMLPDPTEHSGPPTRKVLPDPPHRAESRDTFRDQRKTNAPEPPQKPKLKKKPGAVAVLPMNNDKGMDTWPRAQPPEPPQESSRPVPVASFRKQVSDQPGRPRLNKPLSSSSSQSSVEFETVSPGSVGYPGDTTSRFAQLNVNVPQSTFKWKDVYWDGVDKDACQQILRHIGTEGVFMVRKGEDCDNYTLMCFAENQVRKYRIIQEDRQYYIKKDSYTFPSIMELLKHYTHNNLPNRVCHLAEPYTHATS